MLDRYDIVIVGAGPAGLCAARRIAQLSNSPKTLLIEKCASLSKPVACAEGVGRLGFKDAIEPKQEWIRYEVRKATFHSPRDEKITYEDPNRGFILDRTRMQRDLTREALSKGMEGVFGHSVKAVSPLQSDGMRTLRLSNGDMVKAKIVIDCSGPLSKIGSEDSVIEWKNSDLEVAYFAHVSGIDVTTDRVHLYVGEKIAPGGYAWAFPRAQDGYNAGIVIGSTYKNKVNIRTLLTHFLQFHFPNGKITGTFAGTIPCATGKRIMAVPGMIKAGDCAATVNPISRAGIVEAMMCGSLAGEYSLKMLDANEKHIHKACKDYQSAWMEKRGKSHAKMAKVKSEMFRIPDKDYDNAAKSLSSVPQQQLTMSRIFRSSLSRFPRLVWAMRHLM